MSKKDFKKIYKDYFHAPRDKPVIIELPQYQYLMVDGNGHPEDKEFQQAVGALFATAFITKFLIKASNPENDYVVPPMEVRWYINRDKHGSGRYGWTMMIIQPPFVTEKTVQKAIEEAGTRSAKKKKPLPKLDNVHLGTLHEGLCAQILHKGPYGDPMEKTFNILKKDVSTQGYDYEKESHDIYFNNALHTTPDKLKTLIRVRLLGKK